MNETLEEQEQEAVDMLTADFPPVVTASLNGIQGLIRAAFRGGVGAGAHAPEDQVAFYIELFK